MHVQLGIPSEMAFKAYIRLWVSLLFNPHCPLASLIEVVAKGGTGDDLQQVRGDALIEAGHAIHLHIKTIDISKTEDKKERGI